MVIRVNQFMSKPTKQKNWLFSALWLCITSLQQNKHISSLQIFPLLFIPTNIPNKRYRGWLRTRHRKHPTHPVIQCWLKCWTGSTAKPALALSQTRYLLLPPDYGNSSLVWLSVTIIRNKTSLGSQNDNRTHPLSLVWWPPCASILITKPNVK